MPTNLILFEHIVTCFLVLCFVAIFFVLAKPYLLKMRKEQQLRTALHKAQIEANRKRLAELQLQQKVSAESPRVKKLYELNRKYHFYTFSTRSFQKVCNSKAEYDRLSMDDVLSLIIKENLGMFRDYNNRLKKNKQMYKKYCQEYAVIYQEVIDSEEDIAYKRAECCVFESKKHKEISTYHIEVEKVYHSPKERNVYSDKRNYDNNSIYKFIKQIEQLDLERERQKAQTEYERSLMTSALRYDTLKRDKGRCVLCGATAEDGVKLHVDHILPVSKGGKTIPSNLRTLCDRCNLGKKDKYDSEGFN